MRWTPRSRSAALTLVWSSHGLSPGEPLVMTLMPQALASASLEAADTVGRAASAGVSETTERLLKLRAEPRATARAAVLRRDTARSRGRRNKAVPFPTPTG